MLTQPPNCPSLALPKWNLPAICSCWPRPYFHALTAMHPGGQFLRTPHKKWKCPKTQVSPPGPVPWHLIFSWSSVLITFLSQNWESCQSLPCLALTQAVWSSFFFFSAEHIPVASRHSGGTASRVGPTNGCYWLDHCNRQLVKSVITSQGRIPQSCFLYCFLWFLSKLTVTANGSRSGCDSFWYNQLLQRKIISMMQN